METWTVLEATDALDRCFGRAFGGALRPIDAIERMEGEEIGHYVAFCLQVLLAGMVFDDVERATQEPATWYELGRRLGLDRTTWAAYRSGARRYPSCAAALIRAGAANICPCGQIFCEGCGDE